MQDELKFNLDAEMKKSSDLAMDAIEAVSGIILGKERQIRLAICCALAGGHLLLEDVPGVGKTTLAHALKQVMGLNFSRIQFTSDLLPGDVVGSSIYNRDTQSFNFHPGPVFTEMLLADEINRSSPKAQSALLESMEEGQVTIEGVAHILPKPFFVIATQNPVDQLGTFPLPESQVDRFLMCMSLGYPDETSEKKMMSGENPRIKLASLKPVFNLESLKKAIEKTKDVHVSSHLIDYAYRIIQSTRKTKEFDEGLSPRAALGLLNAARAWALCAGRQSVDPGDIQAVYPFVASHRIAMKGINKKDYINKESFHSDWLNNIPCEI